MPLHSYRFCARPCKRHHDATGLLTTAAPSTPPSSTLHFSPPHRNDCDLPWQHRPRPCASFDFLDCIARALAQQSKVPGIIACAIDTTIIHIALPPSMPTHLPTSPSLAPTNIIVAAIVKARRYRPFDNGRAPSIAILRRNRPNYNGCAINTTITPTLLPRVMHEEFLRRTWTLLLRTTKHYHHPCTLPRVVVL